MEYPPQINFYRNTLVAGQVRPVRPSMLDLIYSKSEPDLGESKTNNIEAFQVSIFYLYSLQNNVFRKIINISWIHL